MGGSIRRGTQSAGVAERAGSELAERLRERAAEIEAALAARMRAIADPAEVADPAYALGLREATSAALAYGVEAIESSERHPPEIPLALLAQARRAARSRVPLDTVLRRYFAGYTLLGDFVLEEAESAGVGTGDLKRHMRAQAIVLERLLAAVAQEYEREARRRTGHPRDRRLEAVRRLLDGESADARELGYELKSAAHLGIVAKGPGGEAFARELGVALRLQLLVVPVAPDTVWAWFGAPRSRGLEMDEVLSAIGARMPMGLLVASGELVGGLTGWRLTHRQARAALSVAIGDGGGLARYADVALVAAALKDELLADSLRRLYLDPLREERDGGEAARRTLEAYFSAGHQVSATAAALGVTRQTVSTRLRTVEERIGRSLPSCAGELSVALRLESLYVGQAS